MTFDQFVQKVKAAGCTEGEILRYWATGMVMLMRDSSDEELVKDIIDGQFVVSIDLIRKDWDASDNEWCEQQVQYFQDFINKEGIYHD